MIRFIANHFLYSGLIKDFWYDYMPSWAIVPTATLST